MKQMIQRSIIILAIGMACLPISAQTARREKIRRDRAEDVRDRREDVRDRREDVRDRREDVRDAQHQGGPLDRIEDRRDRREDVRDKREDVRDRKEDRRDRRRRGTYSTNHHPNPRVVYGIGIGIPRQGGIAYRGHRFRPYRKHHIKHQCRQHHNCHCHR